MNRKYYAPLHGTTNQYRNGCHCAACRKAHAEAKARWRNAAKVTPDTVHGANAYTNIGCRCDVCTEGNKERCRQYRLRIKTARLEELRE